jgi:hypothetical protein
VVVERLEKFRLRDAFQEGEFYLADCLARDGRTVIQRPLSKTSEQVLTERYVAATLLDGPAPARPSGDDAALSVGLSAQEPSGKKSSVGVQEAGGSGHAPAAQEPSGKKKKGSVGAQESGVSANAPAAQELSGKKKKGSVGVQKAGGSAHAPVIMSEEISDLEDMGDEKLVSPPTKRGDKRMRTRGGETERPKDRRTVVAKDKAAPKQRGRTEADVELIVLEGSDEAQVAPRKPRSRETGTGKQDTGTGKRLARSAPPAVAQDVDDVVLDFDLLEESGGDAPTAAADKPLRLKRKGGAVELSQAPSPAYVLPCVPALPVVRPLTVCMCVCVCVGLLFQRSFATDGTQWEDRATQA